ncbi:hypothetical protein EJ03DRAFT_58688 [Teratosphaeria nubilosa]|uniref:Uncharacterized protein n=1 Tax=Teratosphaeria nubilosa TaxID=161662 RepID=A0A6G1KTN2_9PEZI|nr:hypothetical protein EJ03DRAFT_58688 [Teratosphaeria nubilosa]
MRLTKMLIGHIRAPLCATVSWLISLASAIVLRGSTRCGNIARGVKLLASAFRYYYKAALASGPIESSHAVRSSYGVLGHLRDRVLANRSCSRRAAYARNGNLDKVFLELVMCGRAKIGRSDHVFASLWVRSLPLAG